MEMIFYCPSDLKIVFQDERNNGLEAIPTLLWEFERRGVKVRRIDLAAWSTEQRFAEYTNATIPAIYKKYEVKRIFGTNRRSACWFGLQVPALVVKESDDAVGDTYPHRGSGNTVVTIYQFLTTALASMDKAA